MRSSYSLHRAEDPLVTDPYWPNVIYYGRYDATATKDDSGVNGAGTITGSFARSSTQSKFGGWSDYKPSGANYMQLQGSLNIWQMGSGDWTVEFWIYRTQLNSSQNYCAFSLNTQQNPNGDEMLFQGQATDTGGWKFGWYNGSTWYQHTGNVPYGTWVHVAACRKSSVMYLSLNGNVYQHPTANNKNMTNTTGGIYIGLDGYSQYNWEFYIDDLRVTRGIARYTSNWQVPYKAFPTLSLP